MRGINEIMSALRNIPTSGGVSSMGALGDIAQRISSSMPARRRQSAAYFGNLLEHSDDTPALAAPVEQPVSKEKPVDRSVGAVAMTRHAQRHRTSRCCQHSKWQNPYISAAIPPLLLLHRLEDQGITFDTSLRGQLGLEVRMFREKLASSGEESPLDRRCFLPAVHAHRRNCSTKPAASRICPCRKNPCSSNSTATPGAARTASSSWKWR